MCSLGVNGEGELRVQPANLGSSEQVAFKMDCVCIVPHY